ncbi:gamma subclass chorismate mutase AroQ [Streptomyces kronopolitis]|uniref:gamma subclass chorismate mutase AroQ n=1 Tax=Streptomyces kronopolitis TaxID=1612435 RepID=UPI003682D5F9
MTTAKVSQTAPSSLHRLAELSAQRLATADLVAAAKWGTNTPIDDPAREQQVIDTVRAQAAKVGADPRTIEMIFRDQMTANKIVQRGLYQSWERDPSKVPDERPDLAKDVRPVIDRIDSELVQAIAEYSRPSHACDRPLSATTMQVRHEKRLDLLHYRALNRSLNSVCGVGE